MPNLSFKGLIFLNNLDRELHVQVKRNGKHLLVVIWARQPTRGERKSGIRTLEVESGKKIFVDAADFYGQVAIESPDSLPYELRYEAFRGPKRDFECVVAYDRDRGVISFSFKPKEYLI